MSYINYPTSAGTTHYGNVTLTPSSAVYTTHGTASTSATNYLIWNGTGAYTNPVSISQKATIDLKGPDADIFINGESLNETLQGIKDALRIPGRLKQNPELEKNWDELKAAADHYNKLLKEYTEKQKVWDALNDKFDK